MKQKKKDLQSDSHTHIAVVGPCGAGKSTLAKALQERGHNARQIAQEHSYVPSMWQILTNPDILIYLDVTYQPGTQRKHLNWTLKEFNEQIRRLVHARENCHIYIHTDTLTPAEVLSEVLGQL